MTPTLLAALAVSLAGEVSPAPHLADFTCPDGRKCYLRCAAPDSASNDAPVIADGDVETATIRIADGATIFTLMINDGETPRILVKPDDADCELAVGGREAD